MCVGTGSNLSTLLEDGELVRWRDGRGPGGHPPNNCTIHYVHSYDDLSHVLTNAWAT